LFRLQSGSVSACSILLAALLLAAIGVATGQKPNPTAGNAFSAAVQPILANNCQGCQNA